ncbi:L-aspartate oxidase [Microbacterium koreense]|uniref:L-aspartate oxidase n=1 Tax=Microbacterium koreense TaxID=323761 RepID=A0ABW2ZRW4_9MICO
MTTAPRVLVVGSGIAGLTAALRALDDGCRVTVLTKDTLDHTATAHAQGGIAGAVFAGDTTDAHLHDTLVAGAGWNDPEAVRVLVDEGPLRIRELVDLGVAFDRDADGRLMRGLEAAHSYPRILHAGGDATGRALQDALSSRIRSRGVEIRENTLAVDLVLRDGRAVGVDVLAGRDRQVIDADAVILATGGAGLLYPHTTNPAVATGDGVAVALRAGARVDDLEFVQFHPTVLAAGEAFLVSEAVRGEGAVLRDDSGHRFALDAHPDGELAPRDVVSRAIADAMLRQNGRPVELDATGIRGTESETRAFLASRFPTIHDAVTARGIDWAVAPVPVTPAAHYLMGGVTTDLDGRTSIPGLYAVGEVARTGVHGANRLASNSLLEGAVFGARAGAVVAPDARSRAWPSARQSTPARRAASAVDAPPFTRTALQALMWEHAGLVRNADGLAHAASVLAVWGPASAPSTAAEIEDANLLLVARAVVDAALARSGSAGAHHRSDDPVDAHRHVEVAPC